MTMVLHASDLAPLQAALRLLLGPHDYEGSGAWRAALCRTVRDLAGADFATAVLHEDGQPLVIADGPLPAEATREYGQRWYGRIPVDVRRKARNIRSWVREELWSLTELRRSEYYNEFCVPLRYQDSAGMSAETPSGEAVLYVGSSAPARFHPQGREATLLALLQPAFAAGCQAAWAAPTPAALNADHSAIAIYDLDGYMIHATCRLAQLLRQPRLGPAIRSAGRSAALDVARLLRHHRKSTPGLVDPARQVEADGVVITLQATVCEVPILGQAPIVLVTVAPPVQRLARRTLRERFGLTPRQAEVAQLLAEGCRNREIARQLGISEHTARHHTERVLDRLGAASRAEVAARLASTG